MQEHNYFTHMLCSKVLTQVADPQIALQVLTYAVKEHNLKMANLAVKYTTELSPDVVFAVLPGEQFLKWVTILSFTWHKLITPDCISSPRSIFVTGISIGAIDTISI
jgi:hypothetical protein